MDGHPFYEPTLMLSFVRKLTRGAFSVLLLPTAVDSVSRWQIFAANDATARVDCFNLPSSDADGCSTSRALQLYTSPDPKFAGSVLERAPGVDPNTMQPLVPVPASRTGLHRPALRRVQGRLRHPALRHRAPGGVRDGPGDRGLTVEAWVKPAARRD